MLNYAFTNAFPFGDDTITFEDNVNVLDSFIVVTNSQSDGYISLDAANTGNYGFVLTGGNYLAKKATLENIKDADPWEDNNEFGSKICFCVDGTDWDGAELHFDRKQTYAPYYQFFEGDFGKQNASALRVTSDGIQEGGNYYPENFVSDLWETHVLDFNAYTGTEFELCFEGKMYMHPDNDPVTFSEGDAAYLDNIFFAVTQWPQGEEELTSSVSRLTLYPNPNTGRFTVNVYQPGIITMVDMLGRVVFTKVIDSESTVKLSGASSGVYVLHFHSATEEKAQRVVIH